MVPILFFLTIRTHYLIRQISFQGNTNLDRKELSRIFGVPAGKPYQREMVMTGLARIMEEYRKAGFVFASINPEVVPVSADQVHVQIRIDEGNQIRTGQITISGNRLFPTSDLKRELSLQQESPFSHIALERELTKFSRYIANMDTRRHKSSYPNFNSFLITARSIFTYVCTKGIKFELAKSS